MDEYGEVLDADIRLTQQEYISLKLAWRIVRLRRENEVLLSGGSIIDDDDT